MKERPFSCNLNNAEVISCVLGKEEESALSIVDSVTINFEIGGRATTSGRLCFDNQSSFPSFSIIRLFHQVP